VGDNTFNADNIVILSLASLSIAKHVYPANIDTAKIGLCHSLRDLSQVLTSLGNHNTLEIYYQF